MTDEYPQGSVIVADDPFKQGLRPFFIISNPDRPFAGEAYTVAVMSTTEFDIAVKIMPERDITDGRLNKTSYIKPWSIGLMQDEDISRRVAQIRGKKVEQICNQAQKYLRFHNDDKD